MTIKSLTISGKPGKEVTSSFLEKLADVKTVAQAVRVFLSNQRQGTAKVKTRGEVDRTKKKWYRQKGTGGARHGARSANIFVGGGVSHGPTGLTDWTLKLSKPMKIAALRTALAMQIKNGNVLVVEGMEKLSAKTKDVAKMLAAIGLSDDKILIVMSETNENLVRASRNIETVLCTRADRLNTFEVMNAHKIVLAPEALGVLEMRLGKKPVAVKETEEETKTAKAPEVKEAKKKKTVSKTVRKTVKKTVTKKK